MKAVAVPVVLGAALLCSRAARADDEARDVTVVAVEGVVANQSPRVALLGASAPGRLVGVASSGSWSPSLGFGVDGELRIQSNEALGLVWRYAGLHFSSSIDGQDSTTRAGESPVAIHAGPLNVVELDFPLLGGFGGELVVSNEVKLALEVTWGWAYAWSAGTVRTADGGVTQGILQDDSIYVRLGADACLHLATLGKSDAHDAFGAWACLTASAAHYDDWNSTSIGLKVEL